MSTLSRIDIPFPYGNVLVILSKDDKLFVRLVSSVDGRREFVIPPTPIELCALRDLLSAPFADFDLEEIRLSAEPECLLVHWGLKHMPVPHQVWKPKLTNWPADLTTVQSQAPLSL